MTTEMLGDDLPRDLVEDEILTRVPATYLKGLGSTCKRWNLMFDGSRRFARKHSDEAAKQFMVLFLRRTLRICSVVVEEKSVPVPLPYQQRSYIDVTGLSVVKDEKLAVLLQQKHDSETEIWVTNKMETTQEVVSWSKVFAFHMSPGFQLFDHTKFLLDEEKKVVMLALCHLDFDDEDNIRDMIYIVGEDNEATQVDFGPAKEDKYQPDILYYFPSLVQIERAGGKRKRAEM
ncbi:unnamed protein product [Microthlaspi erraticum]|uniref:F-box associated beta-propeller type 1 domain-containing protein n=1 Tax=Microthlaspi erraticum TaxID=1685480 RepID=A0A6D2KLF7_9BRAS|nr:unnamed protein product [Microthlaspi erraticum]